VFEDEKKPKGLPEISVPEIDRAIQAGIINTHIFSAAAAVGSKLGAVYHRNVYGTLQFDPPPKKATFASVFDLGALTKPLATSLAIMWLTSKNRIALDTPVSRFLKDFPSPAWDKILVEHLLDHTSGLAMRLPFYERLKAEQEKNPSVIVVGSRAGEARVREMVVKESQKRIVGEASQYSEINFMILGWIVEAVTQKRLDVFVQNEIYKPLGLTNLFFIDKTDQKKPFASRQYVATEKCPWRKRVLVGEVHDSDAYTMGGVSGHAGLFGTIDDVYKLCQMLLDSYAGKAGAPFHSGTVRRFFKRSQRPCNKTWALGWDTPPPRDGMMGARMSRNSVGHLSFTGCTVWLDLQHECVTVTLNNRVHTTPEGKDEFMAKFRPHLEDLHAAYSKAWQPPPPEDEEEDPYAAIREREMAKRKKLAASQGVKPQGSVQSGAPKKGPNAPPK
jgi:CubicO group peptidase (beta-lactamase class C family)